MASLGGDSAGAGGQHRARPPRGCMKALSVHLGWWLRKARGEARREAVGKAPPHGEEEKSSWLCPGGFFQDYPEFEWRDHASGRKLRNNAISIQEVGLAQGDAHECLGVHSLFGHAPLQCKK